MNNNTNLCQPRIVYIAFYLMPILLSFRCASQTVYIKRENVMEDEYYYLHEPSLTPDSNDYSLEGHYRLGYADGKAAARGRSYPGLCLKGFSAGAMSSCLCGISYIGWTADGGGNIETFLITTTAGGVVTGSVLLYDELKNPSIDFKVDTTLADTFYWNGYKAGYASASKFNRMASLTGGCAAGTLLIDGIIICTLVWVFTRMVF